MSHELRLKREAAEKAFEVAKEKDQTITRLEELRFLALSTKDLSDDDAYYINLQKAIVKEKLRLQMPRPSNNNDDNNDDDDETKDETDVTALFWYYGVMKPGALILGRRFLRTARALVDVHREELTLRVSDEKLIFNVESTSKYPHKHGDESINHIDIIDTTCEDHFHEVLNVQKSIHLLSGSPTPSDPVVASLSPSLTPFGDSDFGNGYSLKDKNEAKTNKTEHGIGKSVKSHSQPKSQPRQNQSQSRSRT
ncbi:hypothetical protein Tco_0759234 [Tanacetum coccineum]